MPLFNERLPFRQSEYTRKSQRSAQYHARTEFTASVPEYLTSLCHVLDKQPKLRCRTAPSSQDLARPVTSEETRRRDAEPLPVLGDRPRSQQAWSRPRRFGMPVESATSVQGAPQLPRRSDDFRQPQSVQTELEMRTRTIAGAWSLCDSDQKLSQLHRSLLKLPRWDERERAAAAYKGRQQAKTAGGRGLTLCGAYKGPRLASYGADALGKRSRLLVDGACTSPRRRLEKERVRPVLMAHLSAGQAHVSRFVPSTRGQLDQIACPLCQVVVTRRDFVSHKATCSGVGIREQRVMHMRDQYVLELRRRELAAVRKMQSFVRIALAKRRVQRRRVHYTRAVLLIQRCWKFYTQGKHWHVRTKRLGARRGWGKMRRTVQIARKPGQRIALRRDAAESIQRVYRKHYAVRVQAATAIQAVFKGGTGRRAAHKNRWNTWTHTRLRRWVVQFMMRKKQKKAVVIQVWWREWLLRRPDWAATKIQRWWRYGRMLRQVLRFIGQHRLIAFTQAKIRGLLTRKAVAKIRKKNIRHIAALVIQRSARGRLCRALTQKMRNHISWDKCLGKVRPALDDLLVKLSPLGLESRFCNRRSLWGKRPVYLNRGLRLRIVKAFVNGPHKLLARAFMHYSLNHQPDVKVKPSHVGLLIGTRAIQMLVDAGLPFSHQQLRKMFVDVASTHTTFALKQGKRRSREAATCEPRLVRDWEKVGWPAWRRGDNPSVSDTVRGMMELEFVRANSMEFLGIESASTAAARSASSNQWDDLNIDISWNMVVDVLFAMALHPPAEVLEDDRVRNRRNSEAPREEFHCEVARSPYDLEAAKTIPLQRSRTAPESKLGRRWSVAPAASAEAGMAADQFPTTNSIDPFRWSFAENFVSMLTKYFSDDSKLSKILQSHAAAASLELQPLLARTVTGDNEFTRSEWTASLKPDSAKALDRIKGFEETLGKLLTFYEPQGIQHIRPRPLCLMLQECGVPKLCVPAMVLMLTTDAGSAGQERFVQGQSDNPLMFSISLSEVMAILAQLATDLNKKSKQKTSLKFTAADLIKTMFMNSPYNMHLGGCL